MHCAGAVCYQFRPLGADVDCRCRKRRDEVARRSPDFFAGAYIEGGDERAYLLIHLHDHQVLPDDR